MTENGDEVDLGAIPVLTGEITKEATSLQNEIRKTRKDYDSATNKLATMYELSPRAVKPGPTQNQYTIGGSTFGFVKSDGKCYIELKNHNGKTISRMEVHDIPSSDDNSKILENAKACLTFYTDTLNNDLIKLNENYNQNIIKKNKNFLE